MHIGYVESAYPHPHGSSGAGTYVQMVGRELVRRGVRVSVVASWCPHCPSHSSDEGVEVYRPNSRGNLHWYVGKVPGLCETVLPIRHLEDGWRWRRLLEDIHRRDRFSVVEFTEGGDFWHAFRPSFPFVTHLHGSRYTFLRQSSRPVTAGDRRLRRLELAFIRRSRCVFGPSRTIIEVVRREMKGRMPPAVPLALPLDPQLLRLETVEDTTSTAGAPTVLFAGRNDPVKGASVLLHAAPLVRRRVPEAEFLLIGCEPEGGESCPPGVRCLPFMPRDELWGYYAQASLCVVPSFWETYSFAAAEAMATGKAVVASRAGAIPELVVDGETGLLTPPGDAEALADAITALLLDPARRRTMGEAGRRRIRRLADLEANVDRRLAIYEEVAGRAPLRAAASCC